MALKQLSGGLTMAQIMKIKDVAKYLRLSTATVYKHAVKGKIPATKVGHMWMFSKEAIDKWLLERQA
jgi:excisionase family DNA binding protein